MTSPGIHHSWCFGDLKAMAVLLPLASLALPILPALAQVPTIDNAHLQPATTTQSDGTAADTSTQSTRQSSAGLKCSVSRSDVVNNLNTAADTYGIPRQYLENAARVESGCNPNAHAPGSTAGGLGQFLDSTWQQYGNGQDKFDPAANADAMAHLTSDDVAHLQRSLGRSPTFEEAYLAHQQGMGGATCLLKDPSAPATNCVSSGAITGNGGTTDMTSGQFSALVEGYYNTGSLSGARGAVAQYNSTGSMPNSGNFASGSNGTSPVGPGDFPQLKATTTQAANLGDQSQTSTTATAYSSDLNGTQTGNYQLLQQRGAAIGRTDSFKDAMDVNSRMRSDQIQLWQGGIDAVNVWASLIGASNVDDLRIQSQTTIAMTTLIGVATGKTLDIMPGIPSPAASQGGCQSLLGTNANCTPRLADNPVNVATYLANVAASASLTSAAAAPPSLTAQVTAFTTTSIPAAAVAAPR
jgi:hypothetical protein